MTNLDELRAENAQLRAQVRELEEQLVFLRTHTTLAKGISGERLVAELVGGALTPYDAAHDVITTSSAKIEVKSSKRTRPMRSHPSERWQWAKIFGESGGKDFDYLVLAGESDPRYKHLYRDKKSPYVLFLIPNPEVMALTAPGERDAYRCIKLGTNPLGLQKRNTAGRALYERYQITMAELQAKFRL